jgi:hypothetical protein
MNSPASRETRITRVPAAACSDSVGRERLQRFPSRGCLEFGILGNRRDRQQSEPPAPAGGAGRRPAGICAGLRPAFACWRRGL